MKRRVQSAWLVCVPGGVALDAANRDQESRSRWRLNLAQPNAAPN